MSKLHRLSRVSRNKSVDIRRRWHSLQQLVTTSLLQVVNRRVTGWLFQQACSKFNKLEKVCKLQVATSLIITDLLQLDEIDQLVETFDKLQQAGKLGTAWVCNVLLSHSLVDWIRLVDWIIALGFWMHAPAVPLWSTKVILSTSTNNKKYFLGKCGCSLNFYCMLFSVCFYCDKENRNNAHMLIRPVWNIKLFIC